MAREFSLVERDGGRSGQSPVAVDGAGVDYVRRSTNEGAWSTSHLSVDGRASVQLTSPRARLFFSLLSSSGWGENRGNIEWAWFFDLCEGGFRNLKCSRINRCWSLIISREFEASNESRPTQRILESRLAIAHGTPARLVFFRGKSNRNPKLDRTRHLVRAMTHAGACNELCGSCTRKQLGRGASHALREHRLVHNPPKSDKRDWIFSSPTVGRNPP